MTEDQFEPITRGDVDVRGVNSEYSGLLDVTISLSRRPDEEWVQAFLHPAGVGISLSMHPPHISGDQVLVRPPDGELERYVENVDERLDAANRTYEERIWPKVKAERARKLTEEDEAKRRIEDARKRATGL